jgi:hypothetical protein
MTGRTRRVAAAVIVVLAVLTMPLGCSRTVEGTAAKAGAGDVPRNDDSVKE